MPQLGIEDQLTNEEMLTFEDIEAILIKKKDQLVKKRVFDIVLSFIGLIVLLPLFLVVSIIIKFDSKGPVFF